LELLVHAYTENANPVSSPFTLTMYGPWPVGLMSRYTVFSMSTMSLVHAAPVCVYVTSTKNAFPSLRTPISFSVVQLLPPYWPFMVTGICFVALLYCPIDTSVIATLWIPIVPGAVTASRLILSKTKDTGLPVLAIFTMWYGVVNDIVTNAPSGGVVSLTYTTIPFGVSSIRVISTEYPPDECCFITAMAVSLPKSGIMMFFPANSLSHSLWLFMTYSPYFCMKSKSYVPEAMLLNSMPRPEIILSTAISNAALAPFTFTV